MIKLQRIKQIRNKMKTRLYFLIYIAAMLLLGYIILEQDTAIEKGVSDTHSSTTLNVKLTGTGINAK